MGCYHPRRKIWIWLELKPQKVGVHHGTKPSREIEIEHSHCNANRHVQLPTDAPHRHPHVKGNRLETIAGGIPHGATAWDRNPATKRFPCQMMGQSQSLLYSVACCWTFKTRLRSPGRFYDYRGAVWMIHTNHVLCSSIIVQPIPSTTVQRSFWPLGTEHKTRAAVSFLQLQQLEKYHSMYSIVAGYIPYMVGWINLNRHVGRFNPNLISLALQMVYYSF